MINIHRISGTTDDRGMNEQMEESYNLVIEQQLSFSRLRETREVKAAQKPVFLARIIDNVNPVMTEDAKLQKILRGESLENFIPLELTSVLTFKLDFRKF